MFEIECLWCGNRHESEFSYGGESHITRPDPVAASDVEWTDYLFYRNNPKGWLRERWRHTAGCGQWFNVLRHTASHEIAAVYKMGAPAPEIPE